LNAYFIIFIFLNYFLALILILKIHFIVQTILQLHFNHYTTHIYFPIKFKIETYFQLQFNFSHSGFRGIILLNYCYFYSILNIIQVNQINSNYFEYSLGLS
jgi:hypothetical protein